MKYAIISDIHGNLEALKAVIKDCQQQKAEVLLCGGDIVGYGANPKECLDIIQKARAISVAGNHDWAVSGRLDASYFTEDGKAAILWTRNNLPFEYFSYLNAFSIAYKNRDLIMVHGTFHYPENFIYLDDIAKAGETFALMDRKVCFVGHTHVPQVFIQKGGNIYLSQNLELDINQESKYIVNVGSVGQPRDGNSMASYCLYDSKLEMLQIRRVKYEIEKAQKKIIEAGLPQPLANRLSTGR